MMLSPGCGHCFRTNATLRCQVHENVIHSGGNLEGRGPSARGQEVSSNPNFNIKWLQYGKRRYDSTFSQRRSQPTPPLLVSSPNTPTCTFFMRASQHLRAYTVMCNNKYQTTNKELPQANSIFVASMPVSPSPRFPPARLPLPPMYQPRNQPVWFASSCTTSWR